ncbi:MAG TPA: hypothetical protein VFI70_10365 [Nitrososphaeraceae archaeon]|nr:hypothetical protein [Nitrososphaeraceae archaeon]
MTDNWNGGGRRRRIVVIGGVAAGVSAASKAKRIDLDADVKMIQEETHAVLPNLLDNDMAMTVQRELECPFYGFQNI